MSEPRFKRRKEERPAEITEAAMAVFAEKGYDATRVDDVARRAGVSKGFVTPRVTELVDAIEASDSAEAFLRGPFLTGIRQVPRSPLRILVRLMVAEGPKHPDLTGYYWENVVSPALAALRRLIRKGVRNGEFRRTALADFPQLLVTPVLFSTLYSIVFERHQPLDTDRLLESHVDLVLAALRVPTTEGAS